MENSKIYKYGITKPISLEQTTMNDLISTEVLEEVMKDLGLYETAEGESFRTEVLENIQTIVDKWVYTEGIKLGLEEKILTDLKPKIFTFGSYRLGIVSSSSDIDALCVVPYFVTRNHFFHDLSQLLELNEYVKDLQKVPDAYTPIMRFNFRGIDVDLLFACLPGFNTKTDSLLDDEVLKNVDEKTARSLNGCRVNDMLLTLVPSKEEFIITTRFIKHWARMRGIYSNVIGYLGGVAWALLVGRVCQLYPMASPNQLIEQFFKVYTMWKWPSPVLLTRIKEYSDIPGLRDFRVWNPKKSIMDRNHIMPIITPAFPSMNSTHNVTKSTMSTILEEFKIASKKIDHFMVEMKTNEINRRSSNNEKATDNKQLYKNLWYKLLEPVNIFKICDYFFRFSVFGKQKDIFLKWYGWVETKIRFIFKQLEMMDIGDLRPWPKGFENRETNWKFATDIYIGIIFKSNEKSNCFDFNRIMLNFLSTVNNWPKKPKDSSLVNLRIRFISAMKLPKYAKIMRNS